MWSEDPVLVHELCHQSTTNFSTEIERKCLETFYQVYTAMTFLLHFAEASVFDSLQEKCGPSPSNKFEMHSSTVYLKTL